MVDSFIVLHLPPTNTNKMGTLKLTPSEIEELKATHEKIREILIKYGNQEYGDCIIDEISVAVGILPTTIYYEE